MAYSQLAFREASRAEDPSADVCAILSFVSPSLSLRVFACRVAVRGSGYESYGSFALAETSGLLSSNADESKGSDIEQGRQLLAAPHRPAASLTASPPPSTFQTARFFSSSLYGTIPSSSVPLFERLVFRISRGNAILRVWPIDQRLREATGDEEAAVSKSVFGVTYVGEEMEKKLRKLIAAVGATEYDIPPRNEDRERMVRALRQHKAEVERVVARTDDELHEQLSVLAFDEQQGLSPYWTWQVGLQKERGICDTLRRCDQTEHSRMLVCEGWVETQHLTQLQATLSLAVAQSKQQQAILQVLPVLPTQQPPTYFPTNKFTSAFQAIVDTYGVPRYKEVNPGLFTIISFPFLFGVMYGDIGHGTVLTLAAVYLVSSERRMAEQQRRGAVNEIVAMVFGGRYLLLLMGLFAVYCGFVYNDCFSIPLPLFHSSWELSDEPPVQHGVYPFGVDWRWYHSSNELAFFNSLKMKTSVVLGVTQMLFGILLSAANDVYFHDSAAVWLEFVPRLLFMLCTFGYMCFLIVLKWTIDFNREDAPPMANLIQTMIAMFLSPGHVDSDKQLYAGQATVQALLLLVALGSVPIMLLGVPLVERAEHARQARIEADMRAADGEDEDGPSDMQRLVGGDEEKAENRQRRTKKRTSRRAAKKRTKRKGGYETVSLDDDEKEEEDIGHGDEEAEDEQLATATQAGEFYHGAVFTSDGSSIAAGGPSHSLPPRTAAAISADSSHPQYSFPDALITQSIHTIEFVLGCVSNTASYLRLWALSLAHAQLAAVFWQKMVLQYGLETGSAVLTVVGVAGWAGATFAVLLCMDVLECFLHALRLHWVEFQNKFYHADGVPFEPFAFTSDTSGAAE